MNKIIEFNNRHLYLIIFIFRLIVGGTFIISGLSKMIDPWGFIYKIEQYFAIWGISEYRSITLIISVALSAIEFILGVSLANGCYKRISVLLLLISMLFLFPFSLYIAIFNPVNDCGCFGDFWIISNGATAIKNGVILLLLIYLMRYNAKLRGFFNPYIQWIFMSMSIIYILLIGIIGYNTQPLLDFRSFKISSNLTECTDNTYYKFIYEKDSNRRILSIEELATIDSTWTFVERQEIRKDNNKSEFIIYDEFGDDITSEIIGRTEKQLLLLIPELKRADISHSYLINELNDYIIAQGGELIGVFSTNKNGIDYWKDISIAQYEIYSADNTIIKELVRGNVALVYLNDGIIQWKRTINSIDPNILSIEDKSKILETLYINGKRQFSIITSIYIILLLILRMFDNTYITLKSFFYKKNQKKDVTLQETN